MAVSSSPLICRVRLPIFLTLRTWAHISHRHNIAPPASTRHLISTCPRAILDPVAPLMSLALLLIGTLQLDIVYRVYDGDIDEPSRHPAVVHFLAKTGRGQIVTTRLSPPASILCVLPDRAMPMCQWALHPPCTPQDVLSAQTHIAMSLIGDGSMPSITCTLGMLTASNTIQSHRR